MCVSVCRCVHVLLSGLFGASFRFKAYPFNISWATARANTRKVNRKGRATKRKEKNQQMPKEKRRPWKSLSKFILINFCYADECKGISRSIWCVRALYKIYSHFLSVFFRMHAAWFVCVELNFIDFFHSHRHCHRHRHVSLCRLVVHYSCYFFFSSAHQPETK